MPYTDPATVKSPKDRVEDVEVVFDKGPKEGSWSIARLKFDKRDSVGIRWNGGGFEARSGDAKFAFEPHVVHRSG